MHAPRAATDPRLLVTNIGRKPGRRPWCASSNVVFPGQTLKDNWKQVPRAFDMWICAYVERRLKMPQALIGTAAGSQCLALAAVLESVLLSFESRRLRGRL